MPGWLAAFALCAWHGRLQGSLPSLHTRKQLEPLASAASAPSASAFADSYRRFIPDSSMQVGAGAGGGAPILRARGQARLRACACVRTCTRATPAAPNSSAARSCVHHTCSNKSQRATHADGGSPHGGSPAQAALAAAEALARKSVLLPPLPALGKQCVQCVQRVQ